jgi:dCTP deaminase
VQPPATPGVFNDLWLAKAHEAGWVRSDAPLDDDQIQPASIDLRLGAEAYRLRCSFLPGDATVEERLPRFALGEPIPLDRGGILEQGRPYLIPLQESVALPPSVYARANPKSSTGRLDIFTRLITDRSTQFDDVTKGHHGRLYLEVVSRSFTVQVQQGLRLNQLRLTSESAPYLSAQRLRKIHEKDQILLLGKRRIAADKLPVDRDGLFLSLALGDKRRAPVGWRAKRNSSLLDLTRIGAYDPHDFWEPVLPERSGGVILEPEEFYLLLSREGVRIPPRYASEMEAFDPTSGELRTHYAGFFDPGFGHSESGYGSQAALEVRAHDVPFKVEDGQRVCKLVFLEMVDVPGRLYGATGSNYQFQTETLSKHFVREKAPRSVAPAAPPPAARAVTLDQPD